MECCANLLFFCSVNLFHYFLLCFAADVFSTCFCLLLYTHPVQLENEMKYLTSKNAALLGHANLRPTFERFLKSLGTKHNLTTDQIGQIISYMDSGKIGMHLFWFVVWAPSAFDPNEWTKLRKGISRNACVVCAIYELDPNGRDVILFFCVLQWMSSSTRCWNRVTWLFPMYAKFTENSRRRCIMGTLNLTYNIFRLFLCVLVNIYEHIFRLFLCVLVKRENFRIFFNVWFHMWLYFVLVVVAWLLSGANLYPRKRFLGPGNYVPCKNCRSSRIFVQDHSNRSTCACGPRSGKRRCVVMFKFRNSSN